MYRDSDTFTRCIHPLVRLPLDRDGSDRDTEKFRKARTYRIHMRTQFRSLAYQCHINISDRVSGLHDLIHHSAEQHRGIRILPTRVGVGKVRSNVPKRRCAKKRINHRMNEHIGVGMSFELWTSRNGYSAQLLRQRRI